MKVPEGETYAAWKRPGEFGIYLVSDGATSVSPQVPGAGVPDLRRWRRCAAANMLADVVAVSARRTRVRGNRP